VAGWTVWVTLIHVESLFEDNPTVKAGEMFRVVALSQGLDHRPGTSFATVSTLFPVVLEVARPTEQFVVHLLESLG